MKSTQVETLTTLEDVTAYEDYRRDTKFMPSTDWTAYFDTSTGDVQQAWFYIDLFFKRDMFYSRVITTIIQTTGRSWRLCILN